MDPLLTLFHVGVVCFVELTEILVLNSVVQSQANNLPNLLTRFLILWLVLL